MFIRVNKTRYYKECKLSNLTSNRGKQHYNKTRAVCPSTPIKTTKNLSYHRVSYRYKEQYYKPTT